MKCSFLFLWLLVLLIGCEFDVAAKGVAAVKSQPYNTDGSAKVIVFEKVIFTPHSIRFEFSDKRTPYSAKRTRDPVVEWVEILSPYPKDIINEKQIAQLKNNLEECRAFNMKYPQTEESLATYVRVLSDDIAKFDKGYLKSDGKWMGREQFKAEIEKHSKRFREADNEIERKREEARARAAQEREEARARAAQEKAEAEEKAKAEIRKKIEGVKKDLEGIQKEKDAKVKEIERVKSKL